MVFPRHYLLSWGGDFASDPTEVWANNIRLAVDDNVDAATFVSLDSAAVEAALTDFHTRIVTHHSSADAGYSTNTRHRWTKLNEIAVTGRYASTTEAHTRFAAGTGQAGGGATNLPLTSALVITFLTSAERGPGSRGRVFVPQPSVTLASPTFRISSTKATAIATAWRTFLDGLELGVPGNPHVPSVCSDRPAEGVARTINQVQVGDFVDYQGRRRNRLTESRVTSASFN